MARRTGKEGLYTRIVGKKRKSNQWDELDQELFDSLSYCSAEDDESIREILKNAKGD